jgi:hypothetical protein
LLGPDIADLLAVAYSDLVGFASEELAVYDLMFVNARQYVAESLEVDGRLGPVPTHEVAIANLDEQLRRALKRLG